MVTARHEAAHRIFQERPALLAPTFRLLGVSLPEKPRVEVLTPDVTELEPVERRIDSVLRLSPEKGGTPLLLAIEAQSRPDPRKARNWAYYLSFLESKNECPAYLLVVCQDKATAEWASGPFDLGTDDWSPLTVRPLVLGPGNVPLIVDTEEAEEDLTMATFAAMTHGKSSDAPAILEALASALHRTDPKTRKYYSELLEAGLGDTPTRQTWRDLMKNGSFFPGRGTLVEETFLEGKAAGIVEERVRFILRTLEKRDMPVRASQHVRITGTDDMTALAHWMDKVLTVTDVSELFDDIPPDDDVTVSRGTVPLPLPDDADKG
ncbi:hypothetical protein JW613_29425 [Streptomyces smyrnaeus]|uniref:Transposase (putative) YhgA-like domain-containing protein n=1 Tax=Streptomyces smyrnaeus TaxID=1387713 RepID=A0ABS3Y455_9ACTN|nr:hypothetical protein [Streptomyces smyrnaeus]MBO8202374.1 hypothetical protein [Streptomyces smyrnaeus]